MPRKLVEVTTDNGKTRYETFEDASITAKNNPHRWEGMRKLILIAKDLEHVFEPRVTWAPRQSGSDGPIVNQVISR